jgi:geranylgeranyl diphosphate synthase type I
MLLDQLQNRFSDEIDGAIEALLRENSPFVADMAGYFFGWLDENFQPVTDEVNRGKRLRPALTLLVCEAVSGDYRPALPLAVVVELIHNYSLIHDDIADRDEARRGRPTVWKLWGDGIAINTGSVLYTLAYEVVAKLKLPPEKVLAILDIVVKTSLRLSEGQHWDITYERRGDVTQDMYLNMSDGKTAALIEAATWLGALAGTDSPDLIDAYRQFGRHLGLAFQIQDDYLNIWVDTSESGKPQYSDLRNKKKSLPVTYALGTLSGDIQTRLAALYADADHDMSDDEIAFTVDALAQAGAQVYTGELALHHTREALGWLDATGLENEAHETIRAVSRALTGRTV